LESGREAAGEFKKQLAAFRAMCGTLQADFFCCATVKWFGSDSR
jgi:hypothetical protein